MKKLQILFWTIFAKAWDVRPRVHLPTYSDYPIASCDIADKYDYPPHTKILFEWDEKGKHWVAYRRL